jgi:hypothetical protein
MIIQKKHRSLGLLSILAGAALLVFENATPFRQPALNLSCLARHSSAQEQADALNALTAPSGALGTYFVPLHSNIQLIEPYNANVFLIHLLRDNPGAVKDTQLMAAVDNWVKWYLNHANYQPLPDGSGLGVMNGPAIPFPSSYDLSSDGSFTGTPRLYSSAEFSNSKLLLSSLHIPGTIYRYNVTFDASGNEIDYPSFNYPFSLTAVTGSAQNPYFGAAKISNFTTPDFQPMEKWVYDDTDSYGGTFISLFYQYISILPPQSAKWLFMNFHFQLENILHSSLATLDPSTNLTHAAPFYSAEYSMDNIEVWAGLRDYVNILKMMKSIDPSAFTDYVFPDKVTMAQEYGFYQGLLLKSQNAIHEKLQVGGSSGYVQGSAEVGGLDQNLLGVGLDPDGGQIQLLGATSANHPDWSQAGNFGGSLVAVFNSFQLDSSSATANTVTTSHLFSLFNSVLNNFWNSNSFTSAPPNLWWLVPYAQNIGVQGGMTVTQLEEKAELACEKFIEGPVPRSPSNWYNLESGAYIHILRLINNYNAAHGINKTPL